MVDQADVDAVSAHVTGGKALTDQGAANADLNGDGIVDVDDLVDMSKLVKNNTDPTEPSSEVTATLIGDVNLDGVLTKEDSDLLLDYVTGQTSLSHAALLNADTNGDGIVDMVDVAELVRKLGIEDTTDPTEESSTEETATEETTTEVTTTEESTTEATTTEATTTEETTTEATTEATTTEETTTEATTEATTTEETTTEATTTEVTTTEAMTTEESTTEEPTTETTANKPGDVNGDGEVNAVDASDLLIAAAMVGAGEDSGMTDAQKNAADVNKNGTFDASDAASILQYAAAVGAGQIDAKIEDFCD